MKKIYAFTLDSDDYPSDKFRYNLKLIAFLLYDSIYNYDYGCVNPLNINKNIKINNFYEQGTVYWFDSDVYDDGFINYEPFFIGEKTFCLTVNDDMISEEVISELIQYSLRIVGINYRVNINSIVYFSKDIDDERNRWKSIRSLSEKIGCRFNRKMDIIKRLTLSKKYRRNLNCYGR